MGKSCSTPILMQAQTIRSRRGKKFVSIDTKQRLARNTLQAGAIPLIYGVLLDSPKLIENLEIDLCDG